MGLAADQNLLDLLNQELPEAVNAVTHFRGDLTLGTTPERYLDVCRFLRDNSVCPCDLFVDLAGVDNLPQKPRFEVVVHLFSTSNSKLVRVKVGLPGDSPELPTLVPVYAGSEWAEREAFDNYGIRFQGHPDLRRILNAYDIDFYPQRKDFPLKHYRD